MSMLNCRPYELPWVNEYGKVKIETQVWVTFTIKRYEYEVMFDEVSMKTTHILWGRP